jgi:U32 family peptidase
MNKLKIRKTTEKKPKIELLSPAGNMEKMKVAFAHGADAVYAGIPDFSLRVRINDFDLRSLKEATEYAHGLNKKIYITINIFAHNRHLKKLPQHIQKLKDIGVDALIVSDPGVIMVVKDEWPEAEIHLSTQANATNWQAVKFWRAIGVKRIILGREVALKEIKEIHQQCPDAELEYFVHGAMCMAYSGRCFLSKKYTGRSANQGDCIQPCRWKFTPETEGIEIVEEEHGSYILNSKDLCLIKYLKELKGAGVTSFKIEGRAKSVYYQAMTAGIYSQALQDMKDTTKKKSDFFYKELETKLVHRGYTEGFLLGGKAEQNTEHSHEECGWEFCGIVVANDPLGKITVKVHNTLKKGDEIEIVRPFYDIIKMKVGSIQDFKTGEYLEEAHGGQEKTVLIEVKGNVPEFSVIRRKL